MQCAMIPRDEMTRLEARRPIPKSRIRNDGCARAVFFMTGLMVALMSTVSSHAADSPEGIEFFEKKIRPILADNCYTCHSLNTKKLRGGLLLDSREGLRKGGTSGAAIEPGDPDKSLLIKAVRYTDEKLQMPPKGKKLAAEKIADLEAWVKMGAPDPRESKVPLGNVTAIAEKAKTHWAFQPIKEPALPDIKNKRWAQTPVDNFILAKLEERKMKPSAEADKRTLIRRAYFDLIGHPPTPEQVAEFIADKSPNAFARVVDQLLASPQYGERWGRHWLDVARYADTKGYVFEEERKYQYSYTYRDYVIRSFNEDLPFDQFLKQQVAADLLPSSEDKRSLAALGYLTLGRRFINNIHDIIDDRIDVVCRGMMGLTVACARCHDHKYDPIPTKDYYSLYGIFASSQEPDPEPLLGTKPDAKIYDEYVAERDKKLEERRKFKTEKEDATAADLRAKSGEYLAAAYEAQALKDGAKVDALARKHKLDGGVLQRWISALDGWKKNSNAVFTAWFAFSEINEKEFAEKSAALAKSITANDDPARKINPMVAKAFEGDAPTNMNQVAERYGKVFVEIDKRWMKEAASTNAIKALPEPDAEAVRQILYAADAPANLPRDQFDRLFDVPTSQKIRALQRGLDELDATHPGAPPRAMAMVDKDKPYNVQVFIRGSTDNRGPEVPRQFPEVLAGATRKPFSKGSGRLEMAEAITSTNNPLTARVLVNRVWMHHFGAGLVSTASDFGLRADPPTHPQLLDYLAARFMADGWSLKKLHRTMMLSATYQQRSEDNPENSKLDPGNQLVWRMNRQRLEFEAMRDTLLSLAGRLDMKAGGHAVDVVGEPFSTRRSIYGFIDRQNLPALFRTFDLASPDSTSPRRFYTTVPQQALFFMNSPFVIEQARKLTERPELKDIKSEEAKVRGMYELVFQRTPTKGELAFAHQFLAAPQPEKFVPMTNWVFGYGMYDVRTNRVTRFNKLPFYDGRAFQGGPTLPDPKLGWVVVSGTGGHPGNDQRHAAVRRWLAPRDGTVAIKGTLEHPVAMGDGVRGRIVSSRSGELGKWEVHNNKKETNLEKVEVKAGDEIDFVTDMRQTIEHDSFTWSPTIRYLADGQSTAGARMEWSALNDFADAAKGMREPLDVWQKYAQVLLLTNEMVFVD